MVWGMECLDSTGQFKDFVYVPIFVFMKLTLLWACLAYCPGLLLSHSCYEYSLTQNYKHA